MAANVGEQKEAVLFFEHNQIAREMLFSEFEAILDGFVPVHESANSCAQAVYVHINDQLCVTAAVFFLINFDGEGFADKRWNVPVQQFADTAAHGPDLGAGPIRLACRSQCGIAWFQQQLWDPDMSPGRNNFVLLRKSIKRNRLALPYREPELEPEPEPLPSPKPMVEAKLLEQHITEKLHSRFEQAFRNRMAQLLKEQRLRILTLNNKRKQQLQALELEHHRQTEEFEEKLVQSRQLLRDEQACNLQLKQTIEGQAAKIEGIREYFEHKLRNAKSVEISQLQALKSNYEMEVEAKVEAATTELKEHLQRREVELMYRDEQLSSLHEEIARLRRENQELLSHSGDHMLEKVSRKGVSFVAYHQGLGHITIPLEDMGTYLETPVVYAAARCGVTEQHYNHWLAHYRSPRCEAMDESGKMCGKPVERIDSPGDFLSGESDLCKVHQHPAGKAFALVRG